MKGRVGKLGETGEYPYRMVRFCVVGAQLSIVLLGVVPRFDEKRSFCIVCYHN